MILIFSMLISIVLVIPIYLIGLLVLPFFGHQAFMLWALGIPWNFFIIWIFCVATITGLFTVFEIKDEYAKTQQQTETQKQTDLPECPKCRALLRDGFCPNCLTSSNNAQAENSLSRPQALPEINKSECAINKSDAVFGLPPLVEAVLKKDIEKIKDLLSKEELDINQTHTETGNSSLSVAAYNGYENIVVLLLEHKNIDINHKNKNGKTPADLAKETGHQHIAEIINAKLP